MEDSICSNNGDLQPKFGLDRDGPHYRPVFERPDNSTNALWRVKRGCVTLEIHDAILGGGAEAIPLLGRFHGNEVRAARSKTIQVISGRLVGHIMLPAFGNYCGFGFEP